jgi:hypothetical protein
MPEEFKPGCQRPPIKKPILGTVTTNEVNVKECDKLIWMHLTIIIGQELKTAISIALI